MYTRIFNVLAAVFLAGCAATLTAADRAEVRVAGQTLTVAAPSGLCIDPRSLDVTSAGAFMLIGDCTVLGGPVAETPPLGAVLSASVSTGGLPGTLTDLQAFLTGPGAVTLSKSGEFDKLRVLGSEIMDGVLFIRLEDRGATSVPGASARYTRAFFETSDRVVSGNLVGFAASDISEGRARAILADFARATRAANAVVQ